MPPAGDPQREDRRAGPLLARFHRARLDGGNRWVEVVPPAVGSDYVHCPVNVARSGVQAHVLLPGVHRIASLAQRWLLGTHQGAVEGDPLQAYLDEFAFRFNRR